MTDKELLELAAKAAGYVIDEHSRNGSLWAWVYPVGSLPEGNGDMPIFKWSPINDDGDALRLSVKLGMDTYHADDDGWAAYASHPIARGIAYAIEPHGNDPYAATRRAITRAAAEMGKAMP
jgi:hypothetical protein